MSTRCVSCNKPLNEVELFGTKLDGQPEDMCAMCRARSREQYNYVWDYKHSFEHLTDEYQSYLRDRVINKSQGYLNEPE